MISLLLYLFFMTMTLLLTGYAIGRTHAWVINIEELRDDLKRMRHPYSTANALDESRAHDLQAKFALRDQLIRLQADLIRIDQELDHSMYIRDQIRNDPYGFQDRTNGRDPQEEKQSQPDPS